MPSMGIEGILTISIVPISLVVVLLSWMCLPSHLDMSEAVTEVR